MATACCPLLCPAIFVGAGGVRADAEPAPKPEPDWIPSISTAIGFQYQAVGASVSSSLRGVTPGEETIVMPIVPVGLQLQAPRIRALPGAPRVFVHGEFQFTPTPSRTLARQGDPGFIDVPAAGDIFRSQNPDSVAGQGQSFEASYTYQWVAGIGLAFPVTVLGRPVELKSSIDYMGQFVEFEAQVANLACPDGTQMCRGGPFGVPSYVSGKTDKIFSAIGPRLAAEVDVGNRGPVGVSVFLSAQAYFFVGDGSASDVYRNAAGDTLQWDYDPDFWVFQAAAGVRFSWKGR